MERTVLATMRKVELHRHLEGAIRPETILDLFQRNHGMFLEATVQDILPKVQITVEDRDFLDFLAKFDFFMPCIKKEADISRITKEAIDDCARDGIVYSELRFAPQFISDLTGISCHRAIEAVLEGRRQAGQGVIVNFILIALQHKGVDDGLDLVKMARDYRDSGIVGVDIAADTRIHRLAEYAGPVDWARSEGLGVTIHAGESEGFESVRSAVLDLGAKRIGHGVRAIEDEATVDLLLDKGVVLEVCPTSNVQTGVFPDILSHPMPYFVRKGLKVTMNTDDPGISGIDLTHEYEVAQEAWGLGLQDFQAMNLSAIDAAFCTDEERAKTRAALK